MKKTLFSLVLLVSIISGENNSLAATKEVLKEKVIVVFEDEEKLHSSVITNQDVKKKFENIPAMVVELSESAIQDLRNQPNVKSIYKDDIVKLNQSKEKSSVSNITYTFSSQVEDWGLEHINVQNFREQGLTGAGVNVAVIDTGIEHYHPDLYITGGISFVEETVEEGYDDYHGHGTHIAGIIGAQDNDEGVVGVAPGANIYAVKVMDGSGMGYTSAVISAIDWSITNNIDILNISLGSQITNQAYYDILEKAAQEGVIVVSATGNDFDGSVADGGCEQNFTYDCVDYPASYDNTIAVGAINKESNHAYFSSIGPSVDFTAPGVNIISTYLDGSYAYMSGTSMATPYVTGLIALLKEKYPDATISEIRDILKYNAIDLESEGRDVITGEGLVQAKDNGGTPFRNVITTLEHLHLYSFPFEENRTENTVSPQLLTAFEKFKETESDDEFLKIQTWLGDMWVKTDNYVMGEIVDFEHEIEISKTESLYTYPNDESVTPWVVSPQKLNAKRQWGEFIEIQTWLGNRWIKTSDFKILEENYLDFKGTMSLSSKTKLYSEPNVEYFTGATLSPQTVNTLRKTSDERFVEIQTWLGNRWIENPEL